MKNYWAPTPKHIRKFADSLLAASTIIATYAISTEHKWIGITALIMGVVGKFLSNFFKVEEKPSKKLLTESDEHDSDAQI